MSVLDESEQPSFRTVYSIMSNLGISSHIPPMLLAY